LLKAYQRKRWWAFVPGAREEERKGTVGEAEVREYYEGERGVSQARSQEW
jgi:hypothetical protein